MAYESFYNVTQDTNDNQFIVVERDSGKVMAKCESIGRAMEVFQALEGKKLMGLLKQLGF